MHKKFEPICFKNDKVESNINTLGIEFSCNIMKTIG